MKKNKNMSAIKKIPQSVYSELAQLIIDKIGISRYINADFIVDVDMPDGSESYVFELNIGAEVYWKAGRKGDYLTPDDPDEIVNIYPIKLKTYLANEEGENVPNDFSFETLKSYII